MLTRIRIWTGLAFVALSAILVVASACDLNPQPLPPGLQSPSAGDFGDAGAATPVVGMGDSGSAVFSGSGDGGDAEATLPLGGGSDDGGEAGITDGGDGGDAEETDGSTDAPGDAE